MESARQPAQFVANLVHAKQESLLGAALGIATSAKCALAGLDVRRMCAVL